MNAFLHVGHRMFFSPVCFFPCRAACPDVVNVSVQLWRKAWGHGYFFLAGAFLEAEVVWPLAVAVVEVLSEVVMGVLGSDFIVAEIGGRDVLVEVAEDGVWRIGEVAVL